MSWMSDSNRDGPNWKFYAAWLGVLIYVCWQFYDRSLGMSGSDVAYIDARLDVLLKIVWIWALGTAVMWGLSSRIFKRK